MVIKACWDRRPRTRLGALWDGGWSPREAGPGPTPRAPGGSPVHPDFSLLLGSSLPALLLTLPHLLSPLP